MAGFTDQYHLVEASLVKGTRQQGQDRPVRRDEPRLLESSQQDADLVPKGGNLGVTLVAGPQHQPETSDQEPEQVRNEQGHGRSRYRSPTL
ncbi:MAG: hypothetical protein GY745_23280 [Actinomycetia bacterium]|nr:hypothetical protein [Actinomycetes bacterium]MCP4087938.1 hypothetical protein [Actinomycetes bacterium]